jgi:ketosteroid isomerase-like protein
VTEAREEDVIRQLEDRRYDAVVAGDFTAFEALCHPELTYTHSTAVVDSLESYLRKCHDGHYDYHSIEHPVSAVRIIGDTALVFGEMKADLTAGGVRKQLDNLSLAVWTKLDGEWKLLAFQPTVKPGA